MCLETRLAAKSQKHIIQEKRIINYIRCNITTHVIHISMSLCTCTSTQISYGINYITPEIQRIRIKWIFTSNGNSHSGKDCICV